MSFAEQLHEEHKTRRARWFPAKKPMALAEIIAERERIAAQGALLDAEIEELERKRERLRALRVEFPKGRPSIREIIAFVCHKYEISENDFSSNRRNPHLVLPRHIAFWLIKKMTPLTLTNIGKQLGRDHTTVIHGLRKIEVMRADPAFAAELNELLDTLNSKVGA